MTVQHLDKAEVFAAHALRWLGQIFDDRSMPWSCLRTATMIASAIQDDGREIDDRLVAERARRVGCRLESDVQALVRGGHLVWRRQAPHSVKATMRIKPSSRGSFGGRHGR